MHTRWSLVLLVSACQTDASQPPAPIVSRFTFDDLAPPPASVPRPIAATPTFGPAVRSADPPPPISGGTLLITRDGSYAVASDPDRGNIYVVDLQKRALQSALKVEFGREPGRAVEDASGRVHVVIRDAGKIASFTPTQSERVIYRDACAAPRGIAHEPTADTLVIACAGGELMTLPSSCGSATLRMQLDADLRDVIVLTDRIVVSRFRAAEVVTLNKSFALMQRMTPVRTTTMSSSTAWRLTTIPGSDDALVLHQRAQDTPLGGSIDGTVVTEAQTNAGPVAYYGTDTSPTTRTCVPGVLQSTVSFVEKARTRSFAIGNAVLAVDMAIAPNRQTAAIAMPSNAFIDNAPTVRLPLLVDGALDDTQNDSCIVPAGLAIAGQPVAVAFTAQSTLLIQTREPAVLRSANDDIHITLSTESRADTGHDLFHANSGRGVSCASCHAEGGDDGHTWLFAEGARRTPALRGGLAATKPFHWSGNQKDIATVMRGTFEVRMAGPALSEPQLGAMEHWLETIPNIRTNTTTDESRGEATFAARGAACHAGPAFTSNSIVDDMNVPGLRGVAFRAPYLHTGQAPTLHYALEHAGVLLPAESDDVVAFLKTL